MYPLIEKWEQSGQIREVFCEAHGLTIGLFAYWRKKYVLANCSDSRELTTGFVPIELPKLSSTSILTLSVGDSRLEFHQLPAVSYLKELLD